MDIKQLDPQTARRICSGQVIASMSSAIKELIENALDAEATSIVIRFIEQGKDSIEVIDNGCGIDAGNFGLLCRRNCTSKLLKFDELNNVNTYGFRGQALNSLCNLCELQIHTRHSNQQIGTVIKFDTNGEIISEQNRAREIGTTVTLANLFKPLPVRRKELCQNLRRSFDKTLAMIYQYCVGMIGFRLSSWHRRNGSYEILFNNNGQSIQSNIISIFNYKQFSHLMPFVLDEDAIDGTSDDQVQINGYISKPDKGCGRSLQDRQYFYINNRPCDLPQICRQINQIYRQYNRHQYPFVVLRIDAESRFIDLNCTPDKRTILLANHHYIARLIERSLIRMFDRDTNEVLMNQTQTQIRSFLSVASDKTKCSTPIKPNIDIDHEILPVSQIAAIEKPELVLIREPQSQTAVESKHPYFESLKIPPPLIINQKGSSILPERKKTKREPPISVIITDESEMNMEGNDSSRDEIIIDVTIENICSGYRQNRNISREKYREIQDGPRVKIGKELLGEARIIGQYNLGFIVVHHDDNLFVLDQHALDERYNYEQLLANPPISRQRMVIAKRLKLSTTSEMLLLDNIDTFRQFGFDFNVDYDGPIGHRIQMTQIPMANRWTANESDIEELIAVLFDTPALVINTDMEKHYSRFMFSGLKREIASKACRSSIMIGDYLTPLQMKMLVAKMVNVRNPWHCAHNRPTIRHLISLKNL
ncbi:mismatch repair endonuclease PMS2-like protein [Euroglyphus maynei]|uniref:Mismatch repair endonuclease PMS2-like protein n=1 Tax=Euroglyphus maynei TaxID=6958 RepID=A0A1Y3BPR3_EURMA|nr:mismatch repair endonuclease PMS2-like protein [Euroglyphus maynei]